MALSGSKTGSGTIYWQDSTNNKVLVFSWTATQNVEANTSTISWTLSFTGSSGGYVSGVNWSVYLSAVTGTLSGTVSGSGSQQLSGTSGTLKTGTATLAAREDGTSSFKASFSGTCSGTAHTSSGEATWSLNDIPRNELAWTKVNGSWKQGKTWVKVNGTQKEGKKVWVKVGGSWKESAIKG